MSMTNIKTDWSRRLLQWDCAFLLIAGVAGLAMDLASHVGGLGPFGETFLGNPLVIGVIEAHGLAVLAAIGVMTAPASVRVSRHIQLAAIHLLLGGSNIFFFDVFRLTGGETQGIVVTVVHFAFVAANFGAAAWVWRRNFPAGRNGVDENSGEGALFRAEFGG